MEENEEEEDDDTYPRFPEYDGTTMGEEAEEEASDEPADDLGGAIWNAKRNCASEREKLKFDRMLEDHKKGCTPIAKMATQSSVPHWNCCSGRQRMQCLTKDLRSY